MNKIFYRKPITSDDRAPFVFRLPSAISGKKNQHVETLRGLAIILVVLGHMIGYDAAGGMKVSDDSIFRYIYYTLEYIRMPLFTVISGWVYANKPILQTNQHRFIKGKLRRLIVPMFVISTLLFLFRMIVPGTSSKPELQNLPRNIIFPYDVYWFLFSLFIIFLVISFLDQKEFFHRIEGWFLTLITAFAVLFVTRFFLDATPNFVGFKGAVYLFPFFIIGIGIYRFPDFLLNDRTTLFLFIVFIAGITIQQMIWFGYFPQQHKQSVLGMSTGISAVILLFRLKLKNDLLIWIGSFAYGIFLFHVFFTGGTRIILLRLGVENQWVILVAGVFFAILFSILAEMVISRITPLRFAFLGLKRNEK
jgi:fucose 4-O-acetylase-like acetyltransferase